LKPCWESIILHFRLPLLEAVSFETLIHQLLNFDSKFEGSLVAQEPYLCPLALDAACARRQRLAWLTKILLLDENLLDCLRNRTTSYRQYLHLLLLSLPRRSLLPCCLL